MMGSRGYGARVRQILSKFIDLRQVAVSGAKVRADLPFIRIVPQLDAKKWLNSVPLVPITSACCTCVPGLLPQLRHNLV